MSHRPAPCLFAGLGLALALLLSACGKTAQPPPAQAPAAGAPQGDALLFAIHPYDTPSRLLARFQPLCDYLGAEIGRPVRPYIAHSYDDQIRLITGGQVDLAYLGPAPYLSASGRIRDDPTWGGLELVAAETLHGVAGYRSVILVREQSPIQTLADLRGRRFAFADHRSYGGHFIPRAQLWEAGLTLADLGDYSYLGRHERVALAVAHGDFDGGGLREDVARLYLDRGLRIIATSPLLPPHVIVARPGLDPDLAAAVRQALIEPSPALASALAALGEGEGFAAVEAGAFEPARQMVKAIEGALPALEAP
ncbi:MAG: phosphate/phosphite/phosphonate ABC transporter substrate-binding protein [Chromatiaceae bacterium]|nr:phosphate/phosphite/phosphonate ABC transporter substrate-binding protein [Chromatiaceae bacterium]